MVARKYSRHNENMKVVKSNSTTFDSDRKRMTLNQLHPDNWVDSYADYLFNYARWQGK